MKNVKKEISYFDILGINENSTKDEIKKAYKELAKQYHPDKFRNKEDKQVAEKHFNIIKKAYEEILKSFSTDENEQYLENIYENIDFIKFFSQSQANVKINTNTKYNSKQEQEAISFMESKIKDFNINWVFVYECIRKEKMFILWDVNSKELSKIMTKEVIFRQYIMDSPLYQCFVKNRKLFINPKIELRINIDPSTANQKFNHKITYIQKTICDNCCGSGCNNCNNGIVDVSVDKILKFSKIEDGQVYKIEKSGFTSSICEGDLVINFKYSNIVSNNFEVKQLTRHNYSQQLADVWNVAYVYIKRIINNIIYYKTHSIYIGIICLLIITIILLAVLL